MAGYNQALLEGLLQTARVAPMLEDQAFQRQQRLIAAPVEALERQAKMQTLAQNMASAPEKAALEQVMMRIKAANESAPGFTGPEGVDVGAMRNAGINTPPGYTPRNLAAEQQAVTLSNNQQDRGIRVAQLLDQFRRTGILGDKANAAAAGKTQAQPEATLPPETLDFMAGQVLKGDKSVFANLGRGAQGAANIVALRKRVVEKAGEAGMSPADITAAGGELMGFNAAQRSLGTRTANFMMAKSEADKMSDLIISASEKVPRGEYRPVNYLLNAWETNTGGVEIRKLGASINSFINAYARAISPIGVPAQQEKNHAREMLSSADSHEQLKGIIDQLKLEMKAAGEAPSVTKEQLREGLTGSGGAPAAPSGGWNDDKERRYQELLRKRGG